MKKLLVMLLITMMMINVIPVNAVTYNEYKKGDKIKVKVNDKDTFEFYVLEDSGSSSDTVKAIYSGVLSGTFNYENATKKVTSLKDTWKNVSSIALPKMEDVFGSDVDLNSSFEYPSPSWALSSSRYWTSNKTNISNNKSIGSLKDKILADNDEQSDKYMNFRKITSATNGRGLYSVSLKTQGNKITYYFRGAVENNYVKFGKNTNGQDLYWRIMRINEDGSIRLIYSGIGETETASNGKVIDKDVVLTPSVAFGALGYTYGEGQYVSEYTANKYESTIKKFLDSWYTNNLEANYGKYISGEAGFCNDRNEYFDPELVYPSVSDEEWDSFCDIPREEVSCDDWVNGELWNAPPCCEVRPPFGKEEAANNVLYRAYYYQPQFLCPKEERDLFTPTTSSSGNKVLTKPIGLPTADDLMYAGAVFDKTNDDFYLYNNADIWTMSPTGSVMFVLSKGFLDYTNLEDNENLDYKPYHNPNVENYSMHARPVINLSSTVEVLQGNGTHDNPYVVNTGDSVSTDAAWTLGGSEKGMAKTEIITNELSVKPVITISKQYIDGSAVTPDDGDDDGQGGTTDPGNGGNGDSDDGDDGKGDGTTVPDDEPKNPSTGDNVLVLICFTLILGAAAVYAYRRKMNN